MEVLHSSKTKNKRISLISGKEKEEEKTVIDPSKATRKRKLKEQTHNFYNIELQIQEDTQTDEQTDSTDIALSISQDAFGIEETGSRFRTKTV